MAAVNEAGTGEYSPPVDVRNFDSIVEYSEDEKSIRDLTLNSLVQSKRCMDILSPIHT